MAQEMTNFLDAWGITQRVSSAYNAVQPPKESPGRAGRKVHEEAAQGQSGPQGALDNDSFARALMTYRSPAQVVFGRVGMLILILTFKDSRGAIRITS